MFISSEKILSGILRIYLAFEKTCYKLAALTEIGCFHRANIPRVLLIGRSLYFFGRKFDYDCVVHSGHEGWLETLANAVYSNAPVLDLLLATIPAGIHPRKIMKLFRRLLALATLFAFATGARADVTNPGNPPGNNSVEVSPYAVVERGPHHRVWQQVTVSTNLDGGVDYRTNSYKELATGMHHLVSGQWIESDDQIQITANGGIASNSQHQALFLLPHNINTAAAIDLLTPDGFHLQSHVMGLGFADPVSGKGVLIADLQDSIGQLLSSGNQVIYTNAFGGGLVQAAVRYSQKVSGFEQDIILQQQLPDPSQFGLEPGSTKLQIWTEFILAPTPQKTVTTDPDTGLVNEDLDFGTINVARGNAFTIGDETVLVPVAKHWSVIQGRTFLIEEVLLSSIATQMQSLPPPTQGGSSPGSLPSGNGGQSSLSRPCWRHSLPVWGRVYGIPASPRCCCRAKLPEKRCPAANGLRPRPRGRKGLVLDYVMLNSSQTNYVFQADTTYYISGAVNLYQTSTLEGGAVIKYTNLLTAQITLNGPLVSIAGLYRPAVLTSKDDNSLGAVTGRQHGQSDEC